jgi:hypothetical protein
MVEALTADTRRRMVADRMVATAAEVRTAQGVDIAPAADTAPVEVMVAEVATVVADTANCS